jgi:hypothetical protein
MLHSYTVGQPAAPSNSISRHAAASGTLACGERAYAPPVAVHMHPMLWPFALLLHGVCVCGDNAVRSALSELAAGAASKAAWCLINTTTVRISCEQSTHGASNTETGQTSTTERLSYHEARHHVSTPELHIKTVTLGRGAIHARQPPAVADCCALSQLQHCYQR